jgi:hypothetical protein
MDWAAYMFGRLVMEATTMIVTVMAMQPACGLYRLIQQ